MIRHATFKDYDAVMDMMINFANSSPYAPFKDPQYSDHYVRRLLDSFLKNGCILVGEKNEQIVGMLIAQIQQDAWLPHVKTMKEIAWWVEPEHRMSSLGYRLLKKYVEVGKELGLSR